ncbi:hypothetical protein VCBJG01_2058, partial [Vibrio cholerae BJG-01]
MLSFITQK